MLRFCRVYGSAYDTMIHIWYDGTPVAQFSLITNQSIWPSTYKVCTSICKTTLKFRTKQIKPEYSYEYSNEKLKEYVVSLRSYVVRLDKQKPMFVSLSC